MATTRVAVAPMKVAHIAKARGDFEIIEREIPNPGSGQVRVKVQACGICHSDVLTKEGVHATSIRRRSSRMGTVRSGDREIYFYGQYVGTIGNALYDLSFFSPFH